MRKIHRQMMRALVSSLFIVLISLSAVAEETKKPINLVRNGGFEEAGLWPFVPSGADASGGIVDGVAHTGKHSCLMSNKSGFAPNVYARITQPQNALRPFTTYRISCW